jgi:hypothetical protein
MADDDRIVDVHMGPYRGSRLRMTAADADAAINAHWAHDPITAYDPDHAHEPLTDQQREDAMTAAHAWAHATWDAAQGVAPPEPPPPEGGVTRKRAMKPEEGHDYKTRDA